MARAGTSVVDEADRLIEERSLLKHPFFQAWQRGEPTLVGVYDPSVTVGAAG